MSVARPRATHHGLPSLIVRSGRAYPIVPSCRWPCRCGRAGLSATAVRSARARALPGRCGYNQPGTCSNECTCTNYARNQLGCSSYQTFNNNGVCEDGGVNDYTGMPALCQRGTE